MKRTLSLVLALVIVLSLGCVTAFAASPDKETYDTSTTTTTTKATMSTVEGALADVNGESDWASQINVTALDDIAQLTEEQAADYKAAYEALKDATPAGMNASYLFYVTPKAENVTAPYTLTLKMADVKDAGSCVAALYADGAWTAQPTTVNGDGTVSATISAFGAVAIFTK